jgi:hypothetical protein
MYHTWIHLLHHSPLPHPFLEQFQQVPFLCFHIGVHSFTPYSSSYPFPQHLPHPIGTKPPRQDLFCSTILWFCRRKEKKWHLGLFLIKVASYVGSFLLILPCIYISHLQFIHLLCFSSFCLRLFYGGFSHFYNAIFIFV